MATPLECPYCAATFTLAEWSQRAGCPVCGRRVTFFEASGQAASGAGGRAAAEATPGSSPGVSPAGAAGVGPPGAGTPGAAASPSPGPPTGAVPGAGTSKRPRTFLGKPLVWTRAWTAVVVVWVVVATLLFAARAGMGTLTEYTTEDRMAFDAVPVALMPDGETSYDEALDAMYEGYLEEVDSTVDLLVDESWYILSRPWEDRVFIVCEIELGTGDTFTLGWVVEEGQVTADPETLRFLEEVAEPGADASSIALPDDPEFLAPYLWE